jgi:pimeloyl-ACP methyl ester carboxylesterase
MAPVCRELSDAFTVVEPLQRLSGAVPLTVAQHVSDLRNVMERYAQGGIVTLVGHSWGAMLALALAAEYPGLVRGLVLIGCGTFDTASRRILEATVEQRMTPDVRLRLRRLPRTVADPDVRMCVMGRLVESVYSYELEPHTDETEYHDSQGHRESWQDMLRLQRVGVYPARFSRIGVPALMVHGAQDPHPGDAIYASLRGVMPQLEYVELVRCGHYPWWERHAKDAFFAVLRDWLAWNTT